MSEREFEHNARLFAAGKISRRRFMNRLLAGGATIVSATALVNASASVAGAAPGRSSGAFYGTPPGQGGTPPGKGGTPPGLAESPPGQGGTPPGKGGTPPGQRKKHFR